MSIGYLACVYKDIQRHIAQYLDLEQFTVSSVVLTPAPDWDLQKFFAMPSGCVTIARSGDIWYYDTHGVRQKTTVQCANHDYGYIMLQYELVLVPLGKQFISKFGWLTTKTDGVYTKEGERLYNTGNINIRGDIVIFDGKTVIFPNGVKVTRPNKCVVAQLSRDCVYFINSKCVLTLYTLTGLCVLRIQLPRRLRAHICDYDSWKFGYLENSSYDVYDFSIFGDASAPLPPTK